jgi:hypothetical protein
VRSFQSTNDITGRQTLQKPLHPCTKKNWKQTHYTYRDFMHYQCEALEMKKFHKSLKVEGDLGVLHRLFFGTPAGSRCLQAWLVACL